MSASILATLDLEDMTPKQLRKILSSVSRSQLPYGKKTKEEQDKDKEEAEDENDSLAELHKEKKGDSKPPKVAEDDLPEGIDLDDEDEKPKKKDKA